MQKHTHVVAFIDILGFKKLVDDHFSGKDAHSLESLKKAMKEAEDFAIKYSKRYFKSFEIKFSFRQFSDCVTISMPTNQRGGSSILTIYGAFINVVRMYQFILLDNNILIRGGISLGGHFENRNMIFSDALVKAYQLESQKAIFPRILLDKSIISAIELAIQETPSDYETFYDLCGYNIITDWDEEIFISPFGFGGELQIMNDHFGSEAMNEAIINYTQSNKLEFDSKIDIMEELSKIDIDSEIENKALSFVNEFLLTSSNEKPDVLAKYKWLKHFIFWTMKSEQSKIKFERYFDKPSQPE